MNLNKWSREGSVQWIHFIWKAKKEMEIAGIYKEKKKKKKADEWNRDRMLCFCSCILRFYLLAIFVLTELRQSGIFKSFKLRWEIFCLPNSYLCLWGNHLLTCHSVAQHLKGCHEDPNTWALGLALQPLCHLIWSSMNDRLCVLVWLHVKVFHRQEKWCEINP